MQRWLELVDQAPEAKLDLSEAIGEALPSIAWLDAFLSKAWTWEEMIGSHRDLHPTNIIRLDDGAFMLVDWDAAGPVVPRQEVACFALVFADRGQGQGYETAVVRAFIDGYRHAGGQFAFSGPEDLAVCLQGRLWWAEQNVRLGLMASGGSEQRRLAALLVRELSDLRGNISDMCAVLSRSAT